MMEQIFASMWYSKLTNIRVALSCSRSWFGARSRLAWGSIRAIGIAMEIARPMTPTGNQIGRN